MDREQIKIIHKEIEELLYQWLHYKTVTGGLFSIFSKPSIEDFYHWLKQKNK